MDPILTNKIIIFVATLFGFIATLIFAAATYELENGEHRGRKPAKWMYIYCPIYFFTAVGGALYFIFTRL